MAKARLVRVDKGGIENGERQEVIIDDITHLGRASKLKNWQIRETPKDFHDAKIAISILESPNVSRNHALFYPRSGNGSPAIEDLKSMNGTFLNGEKIAAGEKVYLSLVNK